MNMTGFIKYDPPEYRGTGKTNPLAKQPGIIIVHHVSSESFFIFSSASIPDRVQDIRYALKQRIEDRVPEPLMECAKLDDNFIYYYRPISEAKLARTLAKVIEDENRDNPKVYSRKQAVKEWYKTERGAASRDTRGQGRGVPIIALGERYSSVTSACRTLRVPWSTMMAWLKDPTNNDYTYVNPK